MHHAGRVVSRSEIVDHLYDQDFDRDSNTIEVFVGRLRRKLGVDIIQTMRGLGYLVHRRRRRPQAAAERAARERWPLGRAWRRSDWRSGAPTRPRRRPATVARRAGGRRSAIRAAAVDRHAAVHLGRPAQRLDPPDRRPDPLTAVYRTTTEAAFDERLGVYLRALVADLATDKPSDDSRSDTGHLADPQFELPMSGWYWQITRQGRGQPGHPHVAARCSPRTCPSSPISASPPGWGGARRGYVAGPDERPLRMVERVIDTGDQGIYLVQVAATTDEIETQMSQFELSLLISFAITRDGAGRLLGGAAALRPSPRCAACTTG